MRGDRFKYIRYPHGDGSKDQHMAELYDLHADPAEMNNRFFNPALHPCLTLYRPRQVRMRFC
ncbi:MAG: hypothetical protein Fues2KO_45680 [Fuerstiella sp.]